MGLKTDVQHVVQHGLQVAYSPPVIYTIALSPNVIFTIIGGPIWVKAIFARFTVVEAAASTWAATLCAIAMQNAAVAVAGAVNSLVVWPLGAAVTQVIIPALLAQPVPTLATQIIGQNGQMASVGTFALTVAVVDNVAPAEFFMVYQKMHPASNVV